jgi:hypothetical protein
MNTSVGSVAGQIASAPIITTKRAAGSGIAPRVWPARNPRPSGSDVHSRLDFSTVYDGFTSEGSRILFRLVAPFATSFRLAADFTNWDRNPIHLTPGSDGVWQVSVPLPPGRYAYRFLLDGDDCGPGVVREQSAFIVVILPAGGFPRSRWPKSQWV